ncbi:hypothetical protein M513_12891 [Trichuris suis]|uniref:EGF-like domain-containing protein n=2 Tax=Trichuris suis TaxID=68888 RepID=A0A085LMN2_9BILA|nr:hypothetical protein M513_12891 [Trichuris suis]
MKFELESSVIVLEHPLLSYLFAYGLSFVNSLRCRKTLSNKLKAVTMEDVTKDERFAHVTWDPKFRSMPSRDRKVKIDNRFKAMFTDPSFQVDYTVDKRGRPFHRTTEENLHEFYDLPTDEEEQSDLDVIEERDKEQDKDKETDEEEIHIDLARGQGNLPTSESEDSEWSLESDDEGVDSNWTELDADAPKAEVSTRRLALCNMDWSRVSARDLYVLFNSFKPVSGVVHSVRIYPSEFGLKRMAEEEIAGPAELKDDANDAEADFELVKGSKRWLRQMAKMRQYEINRLRYYYAVVDCDSIATAEAIYNNCDGNEYQSSLMKIDLRFIPDSMAFDESLAKDTAGPVDCSDTYKPVHFQTAAVSQTKVKLSWDDDDFHRRRKIQQAFSTEAIVKEDDYCDLLASSSGSDDEQCENVEALSEAESETVSVMSSRKQNQAEVYRQLLASIESKKNGRTKTGEEDGDLSNDEKEDYDLEVTFEPALQSKAEEIKSKHKRDSETLTPWQRYLQKRKEVRRLRKMERRRLREEANARKYESATESDNEKADADRAEYSPKMDAPHNRPTTDELELLVAEPDQKEHYHLKNLIKEARQKGKRQMEAPSEESQFKLNVCDKRFDAIYTSHLFNIDPSDPSFKKTKGTEALLEEKRRRAKRRNVDDDDVAAKRLAPLGHPMEGGQPEYVEHSWLPIDQYDIDDVDQWDDSDDDAANLSHPTLHATYNLCIKELLVGGIGAKIAELFALCVIRRIGASIAVIPESWKQLLGICLGLFALYRWHNVGVFWCVFVALAMYIWMLLSCHFWPTKLTISVACFSICFVPFCQLVLLSASRFNSLSGSLMILSMKCISLTFDYDFATLRRNQLRVAPFFGYMLDVGTAMNGPWVTYGSYRNSFTKMGVTSTLSSLALALCTGLLSFAFLVYSSCISWWLFPASPTPIGRMLVAFRDAQAFRSSHYFISFLSQTCALLAGYSFNLEKPLDSKIFAIVDPLRCELPRSLVDVVVSWNRSMHLFLKKYVFKPLSGGHGRFVALFLTYCVSSLLHGVNFQLSAVLLSLGLYTYMLRERLSARLNACVGARRCVGPCTHDRKETHPITWFLNGAFLLLSLFHLAYLGMVYDSSGLQEQGYSARHTITVWSNAYFVSHIICLLTFLLAKSTGRSSNIAMMPWQGIVDAKVACCLIALIVLPVVHGSSKQPGLSCSLGFNSTTHGVLVDDHCIAEIASKAANPSSAMSSFEDAVHYCHEKYNSKKLLSHIAIEDLNMLPLNYHINSSVRLLLGAQLLLKDEGNLKFEKIDGTRHSEYRVPMVYSNGTMGGRVALHVHSELRKGWISFPHFPLRLELKDTLKVLALMNRGLDKLCVVVEVRRESTFAHLFASLSNCDNSGKSWDTALCEYPARLFCPKATAKECVWMENRGSCFWRYHYTKQLYEGVTNGTKCPTVVESEPEEECTCTQCLYTQWTSWSMFQDPLGNVVIIRYRPMDVVKRWDCTIYSAICCTQLAALSSVTSSKRSSEETIAMIQCLNGGFKVTPMARCKCPRGASGLFCEIDHNDCENNACLNGATCRDHLNGYECICTREFYGEYCELKREALSKTGEKPGNWIIYVCILLPIIFSVFLSMLFFISACSDEEQHVDKELRTGQAAASRVPLEGKSAGVPPNADWLATYKEKNEQEVSSSSSKRQSGSVEKYTEEDIRAAVLKHRKERSPRVGDFGTSSERRRIRKLMRQRAIRKRELARLLRNLESEQHDSPSANEYRQLPPRHSSVVVPIKKPTWLLDPSLGKNKELMSPYSSEKTVTKSGQATSRADPLSVTLSTASKSENDLIGKVSQSTSLTVSTNKNLSANQSFKSEAVSADLNLRPDVIGSESPSRTDTSYKQMVVNEPRRSKELSPFLKYPQYADAGSINKTSGIHQLGKEEEMAVSLRLAPPESQEAEAKRQSETPQSALEQHSGEGKVSGRSGGNASPSEESSPSMGLSPPGNRDNDRMNKPK